MGNNTSTIIDSYGLSKQGAINALCARLLHMHQHSLLSDIHGGRYIVIDEDRHYMKMVVFESGIYCAFIEL